MLAGGDKDLRAKALDAANKAPTVSPAPTTPAPSGFKAAPAFGATPSSSFGNNVSTGFGSAPLGGNTMSTPFNVEPSFDGPATVSMSATGKPMPAQPLQPEL
jgi:hypothetical protein